MGNTSSPIKFWDRTQLCREDAEDFGMTHRNNQFTLRSGRPRRIVIAMDLAQDLVATVSASGDERDNIIQTAMVIGSWLAEKGRPGEWNALDPGDILKVAAIQDPTARSAFLFAFASLVGHGAHNNQISAAAATTCLDKIAQLAEHPAIATFARRCFRPRAQA